MADNLGAGESRPLWATWFGNERRPGEDYRRAAAQALKRVLERRMAAAVDRHLQELQRLGAADRRNRSCHRCPRVQAVRPEGANHPWRKGPPR
jgi:hypothetical protein